MTSESEANATIRAIRAGSGAAVETGAELLDRAVAVGPGSDAGQAALAAARRTYLREARRVWTRARLGSEADPELERVAYELFARALAIAEPPSPPRSADPSPAR